MSTRPRSEPARRANPLLAVLLFLSGLCALVYQICWMREFRLFFGGSTAASAAVSAIFIGGIGVGGIVLGRRADRHLRPLAFYAILEASIAIAAICSPGLLSVCRWVYFSLGGTVELGIVGGTVVRLLLALLSIGPASFLMGGTLPAISRAAVSQNDVHRRRVARLYGINTLGAVIGAALATFVLLEALGTRWTLWSAALANLLVAIVAYRISRGVDPTVAVQTKLPKTATGKRIPIAIYVAPVSPAFVNFAAAAVGLAFFLMEMVWYRMLSPIVGGTIFTFGLILCLILLGIGLGGLLYGVRSHKRPASIGGLAITCALEALCVLFAYALGDRLAWLSMLLQSKMTFGFSGMVFSWAIVTGIAVLPAAIVAGYQFPLLIAMLGQGRDSLGRHVGAIYAWNTAGAIAGSLAGAFVLLPLLSAPGCWRAVGLLLAAISLVALVLHQRAVKSWNGTFLPLACLVLVVAMLLLTDGPTAAWRHSGITARGPSAEPNPTGYRNWVNRSRTWTAREMEGVESSIGIDTQSGLAVMVNGRCDGNAVGDSGTQVMSGLIAAILHPHPRSAMVIGLGTGSTPGWLAAVPSIERVDVAELEASMQDFAQLCAPMNAGAMTNPKMHVSIGDGREILLTSRRRYDLIASEPSNPYRAGIASLLTREYYQAVDSRLEDDGIFVQWVQAYQVNRRTIDTIYATLHSVFPSVETWMGCSGDLMLVASRKAIVHDAAAIRQRIATEPYRQALLQTWRAVDLEGFYAHYIAGPAFADHLARLPDAEMNTDDRTVIEFGFARTLASHASFLLPEFRASAQAIGDARPKVTNGTVDWERSQEQLSLFNNAAGIPLVLQTPANPQQAARLEAARAFCKGNYPAVLAAWRSQPAEPRGPVELAMIADATASAGNLDAIDYIEALRAYEPAEAEVAMARLRFAQHKPREAADRLNIAFTQFRESPWALPIMMDRAMTLACEVAAADPSLARQLEQSIQQSFAVGASEEMRRLTRIQLAQRTNDSSRVVAALHDLEPFVPWNAGYLKMRANAYVTAGHPLRERATADLRELQAEAGE